MCNKYILSKRDEITLQDMAFISFNILRDYKTRELNPEKITNLNIDNRSLAIYITKHDLPEVPILYINEAFTYKGYRNKGYLSSLIDELKLFGPDCIICISPYYDENIHGVAEHTEQVYSGIITPLNKMFMYKYRFEDISRLVNRYRTKLLVYPTGKKSRDIINHIRDNYYKDDNKKYYNKTYR